MILGRIVCAVLLNYRDSARTIVCVQSLLREGVDRVLVWDNSEDGGFSSGQVIDKFCADLRVVVHVSPKNIGFGAGVNRSVELCSGDYPGCLVLVINNDAYLLPGALGALANALAENGKAKISVPLIDHSGVVRGKAFYHRVTGLLDWQERRGCFSYPSGCCFLLASERVSMPLFDEDFFMYGEDWELGRRMSGEGDVVYLEDVLVFHEGTASSGFASRFYEERMVAAHLIMAKKISKTRWDFLLLTLVRIFVLSARAIFRSVRYRSLMPVKALWYGANIAWLKDPLR